MDFSWSALLNGGKEVDCDPSLDEDEEAAGVLSCEDKPVALEAGVPQALSKNKEEHKRVNVLFAFIFFLSFCKKRAVIMRRPSFVEFTSLRRLLLPGSCTFRIWQGQHLMR